MTKLIEVDSDHFNNKFIFFLQMAFADGSPIMVLSEESVTLLNTQLKEGVFVENFRPNIVLKGCLPHQEVSNG